MEPLSFAQIKDELMKSGTVLIDVRTDEEIKTDGKIAESKNVPIVDLPDALKLSESEWETKYGFLKPDKNARIICHCKGGMRGQRGASAFKEAGYSDVGVYPGIIDWKNNGGSVVRDGA